MAADLDLQHSHLGDASALADELWTAINSAGT
jgi:hypothetical protein